MLVPEKAAQVPSRAGTEERIPTPGAATSGLSWSEIGVGPPAEKPAIRRSMPAAAAVIADLAEPGEATEPVP
jgi:hypothetical protein